MDIVLWVGADVVLAILAVVALEVLDEMERRWWWREQERRRQRQRQGGA